MSGSIIRRTTPAAASPTGDIKYAAFDRDAKTGEQTLTMVDSYFNIPFQPLSPAPLFFLAFPTPPTPSADAAESPRFPWHSIIGRDDVPRQYQQPRSKSVSRMRAVAESREEPVAAAAAATPVSSFGIDPPRPPRDGFE